MPQRYIVTLLVMSSSAACFTSSISEDLPEAMRGLKGALPPCAVDVDASEIQLRVRYGQSVGFTAHEDGTHVPYSGTLLRQDVANALTRACSHLDNRRPKPARFRIRGSSEGSNLMLEPLPILNLLWVVLPIPTGGGDAEVVLDYEYDGRVYTAKMNEGVLSGVFYNHMPADEAFIDAMVAAVEDISRQMKAAGVNP